MIHEEFMQRCIQAMAVLVAISSVTSRGTAGERVVLALDRQVGLEDTLIVLTADHGVAPTAQESEDRHMPGGRMPAATPRAAIQNALVARFGEGNWIPGM